MGLIDSAIVFDVDVDKYKYTAPVIGKCCLYYQYPISLENLWDQMLD